MTPIQDHSRLLISSEDEALATTWAELVEANRDSASIDEIAHWRAELAKHGEVRVGGGAAPTFTVEIAA